MPSRHIIQKQHLHVNFHGGVGAAGLQGMLGNWMRESLLPAMERVLDELDVPSQRLRINEIKIDAGDIIGDDWPAKLTDKICRELKQKLREMAVLPQAMAREDIIPGATGVDKGYDAAARQTVLLHYLQTGNLPWYAHTLEGTQVLAWLQQQLESDFFRQGAGITFLKKYPVALQRLLMQSTASTLEHWMLQWDAGQYQRVFPGILQMAGKWFRQQHTTLAWSYALLFAQWTKDYETSITPLWEKWVREKLPDANAIVHITKQWLKEEITQQTWVKHVTPENIKAAAADLSNDPGAANKKAGETGATNENVTEGNAGKNDPVGDPLSGPSAADEAARRLKAQEESAAAARLRKAQEEAPATDAEYFIQDAGLVILHPYLNIWFGALGLWEEKQWKDEDAQARAVLLLHYLAGGETEIPEYALPLCKLLTGYPMDKPVAAVLNVTPEEIEESKQLLEVVIERWPMLKNTSVEGLQQSFLQREGKLSHRDNGWHLHVEQRSFDILLQHMPWGISIIKNSRMSEILFTTWI